MSWSKRFTCSVGSVEEAAALIEPSLTTGYAEEEQKDAVRVATKVAAELAWAVGSEGDEVVVSLSGHANPDLVKTGGWSVDFATVSVTRTG